MQPISAVVTTKQESDVILCATHLLYIEGKITSALTTQELKTQEPRTEIGRLASAKHGLH